MAKATYDPLVTENLVFLEDALDLIAGRLLTENPDSPTAMQLARDALTLRTEFLLHISRRRAAGETRTRKPKD